jgi:hypothetical protein
VAHDLEATSAAIEAELGLREPFHDPGVDVFGLVNAVYEVGDTFLEVVSPVREGTTAGRYLARRGGDAGYMAIFQVADTDAARQRVADRGLRVVWQSDLPDISGTHLHPTDVPGAIVSFDTPRAPETWRWAGPRWTGGVPANRDPHRRITGLVVGLREPEAGAETWGAVLDEKADGGVLSLGDGEQSIRFEKVPEASEEGIAVVAIDGLRKDTTICGVRFVGGLS